MTCTEHSFDKRLSFKEFCVHNLRDQRLVYRILHLYVSMPVTDSYEFYRGPRTTSAGYRFPSSSKKPSEFHSNCAPRDGVSAPAASTKDGAKQVHTVDVVVQDKLWKKAVHNEKSAHQQWEQNWGFITEFDPKGRPKSAKELPDKVNMFSTSDAVPDTNSGNYGSRLKTDLGQTMQQLEFQFHSDARKRKLDNEMICY